jgi:TRAP-type C4-dicarboxylate transport system permease small subunit
MTLLQRLDAVLLAAIKVFLIACFSALVALVTYQVISRLTGFLPIWHATEELARGIFIWLVLVGASLGVRNQEHFALQLQSVVNSRYAHALSMAMTAVILMIALIFVIYGWDFLQAGLRRRSLTPG